MAGLTVELVQESARDGLRKLDDLGYRISGQKIVINPEAVPVDYPDADRHW